MIIAPSFNAISDRGDASWKLACVDAPAAAQVLALGADGRATLADTAVAGVVALPIFAHGLARGTASAGIQVVRARAWQVVGPALLARAPGAFSDGAAILLDFTLADTTVPSIVAFAVFTHSLAGGAASACFQVVRGWASHMARPALLTRAKVACTDGATVVLDFALADTTVPGVVALPVFTHGLTGGAAAASFNTAAATVVDASDAGVLGDALPVAQDLPLGAGVGGLQVTLADATPAGIIALPITAHGLARGATIVQDLAFADAAVLGVITLAIAAHGLAGGAAVVLGFTLADTSIFGVVALPVLTHSLTRRTAQSGSFANASPAGVVAFAVSTHGLPRRASVIPLADAAVLGIIALSILAHGLARGAAQSRALADASVLGVVAFAVSAHDLARGAARGNGQDEEGQGAQGDKTG